MSELLWSQLPFVTQPNKDDELLLVNDEEESRRISVKNLIYGQLAELTWTISGTQDVGLGTANVWGNILFNGIDGPDWIQLNADGSFVLEAGIYLIDFWVSVSSLNQCRLRLFDVIGTTLFFTSRNLAQVGWLHHNVGFKKRCSISAQRTLSIQINASSSATAAFFFNQNSLSGFNPVIGQAFIWRLG
jgi:hypothetical protein